MARPVTLNELFTMACDSVGVPRRDVENMQKQCEAYLAGNAELAFDLKWKMEDIITATKQAGAYA